MATPPLIPTFLPISKVDNLDTKMMPLMNTFRGDIVPATFDSFGNINNHPTPFYILCTAKIYNTANGIPSLPTTQNGLDVITFQQFGLTAGDPTTFSGTDIAKTNYAEKNQFTLTTFEDVLTSSESDSPGLLVPVYCYQDPTPIKDITIKPAFGFFRADVFWDGSSSINYLDYVNYLPVRPKFYKDFPTPFGKNINNVYNLASVYTPYWNNNNRIGTWSLFATNIQIDLINNANPNWKVGPAAAIVTISFNDPENPIFEAVNIIRTSTMYTVNYMNQYNDSALYWPDPYTNQSISTYSNQLITSSSPDSLFGGYPLNFLYQVGDPNTYKKSQGSYQNYYQNNHQQNYKGTVCQSNLPFQQIYCTNTLWDLQYIARNFEGVNSAYTLNTAFFDSSGVATTVGYSCLCNGSGEYNATCTSGLNKIVSTNPSYQYLSDYYGAACNNVFTGLYQYVAFQFIPIDFFNVPVKSFIPPIVSSLGPLEGPTGTQYYSEEGFPGEVGPVGVTGPSWPTAPTGASLPGPPIGPTGAGEFIITYPYNGATGATNAWPDNIQPNRILDNKLTQAISGWIQTPDVYVCPELIGNQEYCMFQDYYHSLMGFFYSRPQDLVTGSSCGQDYVPPEINYFWMKNYYPLGGCTGGDVCVPNYEYLIDPTVLGVKPFYCQSPTGTNPYPESVNGFNNTNTYPILNYDSIPNNTIFQPQTGTPITWDNFYTYQNLVPPAPPPSAQVSFKQVPYINALKLAQNNNVNQLTGKTQNEKGPSTLIIVIIVIIVLAIVVVVIIILYKSSKSKSMDVYNPNSSMFYQRIA
jgi:hypothetical protein